MGMLVDGKWTEDDGASMHTGGRYDRKPSTFRDRVSADGSSGFKAESGRYTLYCSRGCPWAHRTIIYRKLKGLEDAVGLNFTGQGTEGTGVAEQLPHTIPGTDVSAAHLHEVYALADPHFTGRVTVPVLWDATKRTIVNNESSEIIRMLNSEFNAFAKHPELDFYPEDLRAEIDELNAYIYENVNNGVYRAGFAIAQEAYEEAYDQVFAALDALEERLGKHRYLLGDRLTEADLRLFPTLMRFDLVYHYAFKCNRQHLYQYHNLDNYFRDLYQMPGMADACFPEQAKQGYWSLKRHNPSGIVPKGPVLDFWAPHDRDRFQKAA